MFEALTRNFKPAGVDFEALRDARQFSGKVQRLRDLKPQEEAFSLPPLAAEQEQAIERLEALESSLSEATNASAPPLAPSKAAPAADTGLAAGTAADQALIAKQIRQQKSRSRIEKIKDVQHTLSQIQPRLADLTAVSGPQFQQLKQIVVAVQLQLSAPYGGKTSLSETEGMGVVRPFLLRQAQKIDCLRQDDPAMLAKVQLAEAKVVEKLKETNPLPLLEKAALLAVGETLDAVLAQIFALARQSAPTSAVAQSPAGAQRELQPDPAGPQQPAPQPELPEGLEPHQIEARLYSLRARLRQAADAQKPAIQAEIQKLEALLVEHQLQARLQFLQRSGRSLAQLNQMLAEFQAKAVRIESSVAMRLLKGSLLQLRNRTLKELQLLQEDCAKWGQPGASLLGTLRGCQRRIADTRAADYLELLAAQAGKAHQQEPDLSALDPQEQDQLGLLLPLLQSLTGNIEALAAELLGQESLVEIQSQLQGLDIHQQSWLEKTAALELEAFFCEDESLLDQTLSAWQQASDRLVNQLLLISPRS
ncbi:MAG TPA: hypothetical protein V6D23_23130 [Candidatus Obscuribacterales bacterium]